MSTNSTYSPSPAKPSSSSSTSNCRTGVQGRLRAQARQGQEHRRGHARHRGGPGARGLAKAEVARRMDASHQRFRVCSAATEPTPRSTRSWTLPMRWASNSTSASRCSQPDARALLAAEGQRRSLTQPRRGQGPTVVRDDDRRGRGLARLRHFRRTLAARLDARREAPAAASRLCLSAATRHRSQCSRRWMVPGGRRLNPSSSGVCRARLSPADRTRSCEARGRRRAATTRRRKGGPGGGDRAAAQARLACSRPAAVGDLVVFVSLSGDWDAAIAAHLDRAAVRDCMLREEQALLARGGVRTS